MTETEQTSLSKTATEALVIIAGKETTSQAAQAILGFTSELIKRIDGIPVISGSKALTQLDENLDLASELSVPIDTQGIIRTVVSLN